MGRVAGVGGRGSGGGWEAEGGPRLPLRHRQQYSVCPVSGTNNHNPQDRLRQSLATVWHHTHPY